MTHSTEYFAHTPVVGRVLGFHHTTGQDILRKLLATRWRRMILNDPSAVDCFFMFLVARLLKQDRISLGGLA